MYIKCKTQKEARAIASSTFPDTQCQIIKNGDSIWVQDKQNVYPWEVLIYEGLGKLAGETK